MTRKLSAWNIFVKKIYKEGKAKNPNYEFKQALEDASKRKSEMGHSNSNSNSKSNSKSKTSKRGRSRHASMGMAGGKKSRKRRNRH
jgi:hypothetical protein